MTTRKPKLIKIALDAMGGDNAPAELVAGAVQAVRENDVEVRVVGDEDKIEAELAKHDIAGLPIKSVPSEGFVKEGEQPAIVLRQRPRASIIIATGMVKLGFADGCVSMGSTGAAMAAAAIGLGMPEGVERPALGGPIIGLAPHTVIIDVGANVDCRPAQMLNFGVIGDLFARKFWDIERPRVALLSVGGEAGKGNRQVKDATELFEKSGLNFIGNVEANELPMSKAEVVVCDGFVGNIVMKLTEGLGQAMAEHLRASLQGKLPADELERVVKEVYELNNVAESWGGGPLFGVNGVSVVGHGRARADAVQRAIITAKRAVESGFVASLNEELVKVHARVGEQA